MVDITQISAVVAAAGVLVGLVYYVLDIRHQRQVRQTDMIMRLHTTFGSKELQDAWDKTQHREFKGFDAYVKEYGLREVNEVGWFFEGLGVLLYRRNINIGLVDDLFSSPIKLAWEKLEPIAEGQRKLAKRPQIWEWFEYLYREMKKREQRLQQRGA